MGYGSFAHFKVLKYGVLEKRRNSLEEMAKKLSDKKIHIDRNLSDYSFKFFYSEDGKYPTTINIAPETNKIWINNCEHFEFASTLAENYEKLTNEKWIFIFP